MFLHTVSSLSSETEEEKILHLHKYQIICWSQMSTLNFIHFDKKNKNKTFCKFILSVYGLCMNTGISEADATTGKVSICGLARGLQMIKRNLFKVKG